MQKQLGPSLTEQMKNAYRKNPVLTVAVGVGAVILAPTIIPLVKPLAKAALKSSVTFYEKTKGAVAETGEVIGDIVAEAKAEVATEQAKKASMAAGLMAAANTDRQMQDN
ncbi:DUF5132 domain-containing protein [Oscillatoria salina IIICB1]|nr:DUF5132 domain-containing protein [Oscillatoria salina IIICB1]NET91541.1 DUF5132 domain-containing protein [Kamptonema sp. SIO1D9]